MKQQIAMIAIALFSFLVGYVIARRGQQKQESPQANDSQTQSPNRPDWLTDDAWVRICIPDRSVIMSVDFPVHGQSARVDLKSIKDVTVEPMLCQDKPSISITSLN